MPTLLPPGKSELVPRTAGHESLWILDHVARWNAVNYQGERVLQVSEAAIRHIEAKPFSGAEVAAPASSGQ